MSGKKIEPVFKQKVVMTVDSGTEYGYAIWKYPFHNRLDLPIEVGIMKEGLRGVDWHLRAYLAAMKIETELGKIYRITRAGVEKPFYVDSSAGQAVAKDSLIKLSQATGMIVSRLIDQGAEVEYIPVIEWKGQMSKLMTIKRIEEALFTKFGKVNYNSHEWDAVGIGLFMKGFF